MIQVNWDGKVLRVDGHAEDAAVCAAVSVLLTTAALTAGIDVTHGKFYWDVGPYEHEIAGFVLNALRHISVNIVYSAHITMTETLQCL